MCRCRMGNPKKQSRFICLHCLKEGIGGIQRGGHQREKSHIKTLYCPYCRHKEKHLEVRYCDNFLDMMDKAAKLHEQYYNTEEEKDVMNRYYVHNRTRKTYCLIESNEDMEVGQVVLVKFDNEDVAEMCECEVLRVMNGLES